MKQQRILILTYYWPPSGGGGVQRWMYFAMYLKEAGFLPTVITVDPQKASYPLIDQSQLDMVRDINTIYTSTREPLKIYSLLKSGKTNKEIPYGNLGEQKGGIFSKISAFIRANFFIPDARKGWVSFAVDAARKCLNAEHYDWLVTTGPPHSTHLAGLKLKKEFGIKWLADFRDPWGEIYFLKHAFRFETAKQKDLNLERMVLNTADLVSTVGPGMAELLQGKIQDNSKIHVFYNGYDQRMFAGITTHKTKKFTIAHIGLLGSEQRLDVFINALLESKIDASCVKIVLAGSVHANHQAMVSEKLADFEVVQSGFMPRLEALTLMKSSDLLLLCPPMVGDTRLIVSTKTMEYLAAEVPILGIGDVESDAATLVKQQQMSGFFATDQQSNISNFIQSTFELYVSGQKPVNNFNPEAYSRKAVAMALSQLLNAQS